MDLSQVQLPSDCVEAYAMYCGADGHDKDWIGCVTSSGVICTWWGKRGTCYQSANRKGTIVKFHDLALEKRQKRYVELDHFLPNVGWESQMNAQMNKPSQTISIFDKAMAPINAPNYDF